MRLRASLIALLLVPAGAARADTGGVAYGAPSKPVKADEAGGIAYGAHADRPAALLRVSTGSRPRIRVRITERRASVVIARLEVLRLPGSRPVARFKLG